MKTPYLDKMIDYLQNHIEAVEAGSYAGIPETRKELAEYEAIKQALSLHNVVGQSEQLNVSFNVGDKVLFDNKKAVVLWTNVKYLDIEIVGTNKILQGVHTSKVLPR